MKFIEQSVELLNEQDYGTAVRLLEQAGRTCYQSDRSETLGGAEKFLQNLIRAGHESVVEHLNITVKFVTSRNITHQIVRHRLASHSQMSTRYVNQTKDGGLKVIKPALQMGSEEWEEFENSVNESEYTYNKLKAKGVKNDIAREVLPGCISTELVMSANVREWRHFFKVRCDKASHYQIQELAKLALIQMYSAYPCLFEDLYREFITW